MQEKYRAMSDMCSPCNCTHVHLGLVEGNEAVEASEGPLFIVVEQGLHILDSCDGPVAQQRDNLRSG